MGFLGRLQERGGRGLLCMRHARLTSHTIIAIALTTLFLSQIAILAALMSARFLTVVSPERRRARTSGAQSTKRRQLMPCIQRARKKRKIIYQIDIHIKGGVLTSCKTDSALGSLFVRMHMHMEREWVTTHLTVEWARNVKTEQANYYGHECSQARY